MRHSAYHALLRIGALTLALVLLFASGFFSPMTRELSSGTAAYVASAIGTQAQREAVQSAAAQTAVPSSDNSLVFMLCVALFLLLALIVFNYALDYARTRPTVQKGRNVLLSLTVAFAMADLLLLVVISMLVFGRSDLRSEVYVQDTQSTTVQQGSMRADFNDNGGIDVSDLSILLYWWGKDAGDFPEYIDLDADGKISLSDVSVMFAQE